eukprot:1179760-Prorocentrum_minimum.AAC.6
MIRFSSGVGGVDDESREPVTYRRLIVGDSWEHVGEDYGRNRSDQEHSELRREVFHSVPNLPPPARIHVAADSQRGTRQFFLYQSENMASNSSRIGYAARNRGGGGAIPNVRATRITGVENPENKESLESRITTRITRITGVATSTGVGF